jgi:hypothetical protein
MGMSCVPLVAVLSQPLHWARGYLLPRPSQNRRSYPARIACHHVGYSPRTVPVRFSPHLQADPTPCIDSMEMCDTFNSLIRLVGGDR